MIGANIQAIRREKNLTTSKLAHRANISRQTIENIENGKVSPRLDTLQKIAGALGLPVKKLIR